MRTLLLAICICFTYSFSFAQITEQGEASFYADKYQNKATASGEPYDMNIFTAAHQTLPFGTKVIVTNKNNGKSVIVRVNDRGPFVDGRIIDLSKAAASQIGITGVAPVKIRVMDGTTTTTTVPPIPASTTTSTVITNTPPATTTTTSSLPPVIQSTPQGMTSVPAPIINSTTIEHNFAVQMGSFSDFNNVGLQLEQFNGHNFSHELKVYETWKNEKRLYKLLVGPYATREEATAKMKQIKEAYQLDCFIFAVR